MKKHVMNLSIALLFCLACLSVYAQQLSPQQNNKGKYGYVDDSGAFVIKAQWDEAENFADGHAMVKKGDLYGFINASGEYIIKPKYSSVDAYNEFDLCKVSVGGSYDKVGNFNGAKYGFINRELKEVTPIKYALIEKFAKNGVCRVNVGGKINKVAGLTLKGGKYGYLLSTGVELLPVDYGNVRSSFSDDGYAWVQKGAKFGYIDLKGKVLGEIKYDDVQEDFSNGLAFVKLKKKYGYINTAGKEVVAPKYAWTGGFADGCAAVGVKDNQYGYINTAGAEIVKPQYSSVFVKFTDGHSAVQKQKNGKWAIVNTEGRILSDFEYSDIIFYKNNHGIILVSRDGTANIAKDSIKTGNWGIVSIEGKLVTPLKYRFIGLVNDEGIIRVSDGNYWGWVNQQGEEVIPLKYSGTLEFKNGFAPVGQNGKVSWINVQNEVILITDYVDATTFENGVACVKDVHGKWGVIDLKGNIMVPFFAENAIDARGIVDSVFVRNGSKPLTGRDTKLYLLYTKRLQDNYKITDVIPADMWDF